MSRCPSHNITTRRNCLLAVAAGSKGSHVAKRYQVNASTITRWMQSINMKRADNLSVEEIDRRLDALAERERAEAVTDQKKRALAKRYGLPTVKKPGPKNPYGPRKPDAPDPDDLEPGLTTDKVEPEDYDRMLDKLTEHVASEMGIATTVEQQIKIMTGGVLLEQLKLLKGNLPPVTTWSDVEKVIKLTRLNFGMDDDKGGAKRVDLTLLSGKRPPVARAKTVEAVIVKPEPEVQENEEEEFEV